MGVFSVVTAPTEEIVALDEIQDELGGGTDDQQLSELIEACTRELQDETYWQFMQATLRLTLPMFPTNGLIILPVKPVTAISSITYYDTDNVQQTLNSSNYRLVTLTSPAQVEITQNGTWPATYLRGDAVQVNVTAGYSTVASVPIQAKRAVKEKVKAYYAGCGDMWQMERAVNALRWFYDYGDPNEPYCCESSRLGGYRYGY